MKTSEEVLREGQELLRRLRELEKQEIALINRFETINRRMGAMVGVRKRSND